MLKPPYRPAVAGRMAFFFGPVAGAFVCIVTLRRTGYPLKAKRVLNWTLVGTAALALMLLLLPDLAGRVIGFAAEIAFYKIYLGLIEKEFDAWQSANPTVQPLNGWRALGVSFAGSMIFVAILVAEGYLLYLLFPKLAG